MYLYDFWWIILATRLNNITSCDGFDFILINAIVAVTRLNNSKDICDLMIFDKLRVADKL